MAVTDRPLASSNPDGSSYNPEEQFIGDYIGIVDGPQQAYLIWADSRDATACAAVDAYRSQIYAGENPVAPNPDQACATSFGNTDTMAAAVTY